MERTIHGKGVYLFFIGILLLNIHQNDFLTHFRHGAVWSCRNSYAVPFILFKSFKLSTTSRFSPDWEIARLTVCSVAVSA